jgi:predicted dehydrogenase
MDNVNVGIIGCGDIARKAYVPGVRKFEILNLAACADINMDAAQKLGADLNIPKVCTVAELLADPAIELVLNLTVPQAHAPVNLQILEAGKHVYVEKPFALSRADANAVLTKAAEKNLLTSGAPDTFLGAGIQTARKVLDDGWIGEPTAAVAFFACPGHERWHPSPEFYYQHGGGPVLDMGPYYITALVTLLGPVARVSGMAKKTFAERTITSQPKYGKRVPVEINTHASANLQFASGAIATILMSFDMERANLPRIEIYGTAGTLEVPDPNIFGGPVRIFRAHQPEPVWSEVPLIHPYFTDTRGIGAADMAYAVRGVRPHRATGQLAAHVLDVMLAVDEAAMQQRTIEIQSTIDRPAPLPAGLLMGKLDE